MNISDIAQYALPLICALLGLIVIGFVIKEIANRRRMKALHESIQKYLKDGTLTRFSTGDDWIAHIRNDVCDLENSVEKNKSATARQAKKNGDFIADISHQFKTPLAGLRLFIEMDLAENGLHAHKELLLVEKMEKLIDRLLYLEKIKSDTYSMDFAPNNMGDICKSVAHEIHSIYPEKNVTVMGDSVLRCDKNWIFEAIMNVVKNACEHTDDSGEVKIQVYNNEKSTIVVIEDNGGGVSQDDVGKLFNRFHRAQNAKPQSAGIGLSITKAIIEKHHGTIGAENGTRGLQITICIPHINGNEKIF